MTGKILNFPSGNPSLDLQTCKLLYIDLQKKSQTLDGLKNDSLERDLQGIITDPHSDRLVLEMACKVYFLLLAKKYNQIDLKEVLKLKSTRAANYIVRGILCTRLDFVNPDLLYSIIMTSVETCLQENSVYTTIALNNLRLFCNNNRNFPFDFPELWRIVALHLSSRFIGAREEALSILEFIVKFDPKYGLEIARLVNEEWPWTYANKFYVLRTVIEGSYSANGLLKNLQLDEDDLVGGLLMALKYKILYTSGQLLFRSLLRKDQLQVIAKFLVELISRKDIQQLHNFHVQWSKEIVQFKKELFPEIEELLVEVDADYRILAMNIFREQLIDEEKQLPDALPTEPVVKQHYYEIILYRITKEFNHSEDLPRMIKFLIDMKEEDNTTLRQHLFSTFTHFITGLIKMHGVREEEAKKSIESFFKEFIGRIIISGFQAIDPEYPEIILSIRLYNIVMRTLHSTHKSIKAADVQENLRFQKLIKDKKIFDGLSRDFFKYLLNQLNSAYDDIRQMAINITLEFFEATTERRSCIQEIFCEKMYFSSMDDSRRIHGYFKILVPYYDQLKINIPELYEKYREHLLDHYKNHFCVDPLKAIECGIQVFDKINIIQEIVLAKKLSNDKLLELMIVLLEISKRMLHFLSLATKKTKNQDQDEEEGDITPSFQVIEESLQILLNNSGKKAESEWEFNLDQSTMEEEESARKRKDLLLAIWMTLKSCGDLSATIVETVADHGTPEIFSLGLEINTEILHRCRHKGAIETVGLSFGRIVAHVSSSRALLPVYQQLDSCLKLLFESITAASYSRRGAGFSFLILNLIKNDRQPGRPLLQKTIEKIFKQLSEDSLLISVHGAFLHYLSVLVNDSSLTQDILPYFNEIISLCLEKIESPEWNVRNAALQLFGALVPKIIGQRQHSETEWEPCQCTLQELQATMPKINTFIEFCLENHKKISRTLLIAILSFLSNVERRQIVTSDDTELLPAPAIDEHLFRLLSHPVEKVRAISALCYARLHRHGQHTGLAIKLIGAIFAATDPNLTHGMLMTLLNVCQKARLECGAQWQREDKRVIQAVLLAELRKKQQVKALCDYNQLYLMQFSDSIEMTGIYNDPVTKPVSR